MMTSSCPGWICYAEKTHGDFILPYISQVKSPQQIMGSLVKKYFNKTIGVNSNRIYHMALMPCFDKKLEASREDFFDEILKSRDVDLVITSLEIEGILQDREVDFNSLLHSPLDKELSLTDEEGKLRGHAGSSSGGYLDHVFKNSARHLYGHNPSYGENIKYKMLRNKDFQEIVLSCDGEDKLRFAFAFGFRNIQNIVQKIKRKKCNYHFIEIMACPSGCVNGGGQIRAETKDEAKNLLDKAEKLYHSLPLEDPRTDKKVDELYKELSTDGSANNPFLHTTYHEVKKNNTALNIKW